MRTRWIGLVAINALVLCLGAGLAVLAAEAIVRRWMPQQFPLSVALRGLHQVDPMPRIRATVLRLAVPSP